MGAISAASIALLHRCVRSPGQILAESGKSTAIGPASLPLEPGAEQRQIGHAGRQQQQRQRDLHVLAGGLLDGSHGGQNIERF
jgi:hypothetical protein